MKKVLVLLVMAFSLTPAFAVQVHSSASPMDGVICGSDLSEEVINDNSTKTSITGSGVNIGG